MEGTGAPPVVEGEAEGENEAVVVEGVSAEELRAQRSLVEACSAKLAREKRRLEELEDANAQQQAARQRRAAPPPPPPPPPPEPEAELPMYKASEMEFGHIIWRWSRNALGYVAWGESTHEEDRREMRFQS